MTEAVFNKMQIAQQVDDTTANAGNVVFPIDAGS